MFGRNLLSRLLAISGIRREFEDVLQAHSYATICAINTAAADIVSTKMAESNFVTIHELSLVSDKIVRGVTTSTASVSAKIAVEDVANDVTSALEKIRAITVIVDNITHTVDNIEGAIDDMSSSIVERSLEEVQESLSDATEALSEIRSVLGGSGTRVEQKLDTILTWISNIDQKIDSNHAEIYNALTGGLRVVYDPSLAISAKKERDQELLQHPVEAGIVQEDANV